MDSRLAAAATVNLTSVTAAIDVRCGDAGDPDTFSDLLPVDLLLLAGIFGNISDADIQRTVTAVPAMCSPGATVIWTRHRRDPDITPTIARWFSEAGCVSNAFVSPGPASFAIGSERCEVASPGSMLPARLFAFRDDLW